MNTLNRRALYFRHRRRDIILNKSKIPAIICCVFIAFFSVWAYGKSLWDSGFSLYNINIKPGDIVTIKFTDSTILKYDIQQKETINQNTTGRKGSGDVFNFYPDAGINQSDSLNNRNNLDVNNVNKFSLPAKVSVISNNNILIDGNASSVINGDMFKITFSGEFSLKSLDSDMTVKSTDIYNMSFNAVQIPSASDNLITETDLVFKTNYNDIESNMVFDTNKNISNIQVITNPSSMTLDFKGLADSKKKELIINYLNILINSLFK